MGPYVTEHGIRNYRTVGSPVSIQLIAPASGAPGAKTAYKIYCLCHVSIQLIAPASGAPALFPDDKERNGNMFPFN